MTDIDAILRSFSREERRLYRALGGELPAIGLAPEPVWRKSNRLTFSPLNERARPDSSCGIRVKVPGRRMFPSIIKAARAMCIDPSSLRTLIHTVGKLANGVAIVPASAIEEKLAVQASVSKRRKKREKWAMSVAA
jgi:hypothetical protein